MLWLCYAQILTWKTKNWNFYLKQTFYTRTDFKFNSSIDIIESRISFIRNSFIIGICQFRIH